jgi:hypothetical protein
LGAVHRYNKHIIILDELYINKLGKNSTRQIVPATLEKANEINPVGDDWMDCYDHAAAWFASEVSFEYPDYPHALLPCTKDLKNKDAKLSLIKDTLNKEVFTMTDRCLKLYWEMENYKIDDNGKIPKENDHAIDCLRYMLNLANYYTIEDARPIDFKDTYKKGTFEQDEFRRKGSSDGYDDIDGMLFDD